MVYSSLDTIPCKLFFKILETRDFSLLNNSDKDVPLEELKGIWKRLEEEHLESNQDDRTSKTISLYKRMSLLQAEYSIITSIVRAIWFNKDQKMIDKLASYGYKVDMDNYLESLKNIDKQASGILVKIDRIKKRLPKESKSESKTSIDQSIYGYASVAEIPISDTNTVTMNQYYAIKSLGEQRLKVMEKSNKS